MEVFFFGSGIDAFRTDLACESGRPCVASEEETHAVDGMAVTVTRRREDDGGRTVTVACGSVTAHGEGIIPPLSRLLGDEIRSMAETMLGCPLTPRSRVLVVGLGNAHMTPDAIGPGTVRRMTVTRHLRMWDEALFGALGCCELSALAPGVMGQTGMESGELVRMAARLTRAELVVAVDALAARSCGRLASTVQLSDGGIAPGAGIGNHRMAIRRETVGCPVMGVGVPTVVDSSTLVWDALEQAGVDPHTLSPRLTEVLENGRRFIVSPRDSDEAVELLCRLLASALDRVFGVGALQEGI